MIRLLIRSIIHDYHLESPHHQSYPTNILPHSPPTSYSTTTTQSYSPTTPPKDIWLMRLSQKRQEMEDEIATTELNIEAHRDDVCTMNQTIAEALVELQVGGGGEDGATF